MNLIASPLVTTAYVIQPKCQATCRLKINVTLILVYNLIILMQRKIFELTFCLYTSGSFLSAVFDKLETAALIAVPFDLIGIMFSGIYYNLASAPAYFSWLRFLSGFYYGVESISILQWDSIRDIQCVNIQEMPCIRSGHEVLRRFGFSDANFWRNCVCLGVMYVVAHLISFVMVVKRSRGTPIYWRPWLVGT